MLFLSHFFKDDFKKDGFMKNVFFVLMTLCATPLFAQERVYMFEAEVSYGKGEFPDGNYANQFKDMKRINGVLSVPENKTPDALSGGGHYIEEFASYNGSSLSVEGVDEPIDVIMTVGDASPVEASEWALDDTVTFARTYSNSDYEVGLVLNLVYPGAAVFDSTVAPERLVFEDMKYGEFTVHHRQRAKAGRQNSGPSYRVFEIVSWKEKMKEPLELD